MTDIIVVGGVEAIEIGTRERGFGGETCQEEGAIRVLTVGSGPIEATGNGLGATSR